MEERDKFVFEMAIREVRAQCRFAEISYENILRKAESSTDTVFSSIHSFLSHCGNVSKFLWSKHLRSDSQYVADVLGVQGSKLRNRNFRNVLEHYDKELKKWILKRGPKVVVFDFNIGPRTAVRLGKNSIRVRHFDQTTNTFTLLDRDLKLHELYEEICSVKARADNFIKRFRA